MWLKLCGKLKNGDQCRKSTWIGLSENRLIFHKIFNNTKCKEKFDITENQIKSQNINIFLA
jgi:hypothetical protein